MSPRFTAAFTVAALVADAEESVLFAGPEAKVTIRATDGGYPLDVDCENDSSPSACVRQSRR